MSIKSIIIIWFCGVTLLGNAQEEWVNLTDFNSQKLNRFVLDYTNRERRKKHVNEIELSPALDSAALNHAKYMAERVYIGHNQYLWHMKTPRHRVEYYGR